MHECSCDPLLAYRSGSQPSVQTKSVIAEQRERPVREVNLAKTAVTGGNRCALKDDFINRGLRDGFLAAIFDPDDAPSKDKL